MVWLRPGEMRSAEVMQPEQAADQAASGAGEDDLPGFGKSLQARREVGGLTDHRLLIHDGRP
jgi:hypothetical protein